jgi:aldehyde:ferredoxin oxidoreductase
MSAKELGGYTGRLLRVDLTEERVTGESLDEKTLKKYIGGVGLGAKLLYDEVPSGVEWHAPENRLIFAAGPLSGTKVAGSGTICVVSKGPLTNGAASTQANGYFGAYLKFSGFNAIIMQGAAKRWLYLYVHDGTAELRDASHLVGKDTWQNEDEIKSELGKSERELSVFGIGPAGENLVKFSAIVGDRGHVAAHNGVGAVMGSKKLKAVAVALGKGGVIVRDKERLSAVARRTLEQWKANTASHYYVGTSMLFGQFLLRGQLGIKNLTTTSFPDYPKFEGDNYRKSMELKLLPCWACPARHCHILKVKEGPYAGYVAAEPEFEGWEAWGSLIGQTDVGAAVMLNDVNDRMGMDLNEAGLLIALVMEGYEKGVLNKNDTGGLEMTWGNAEAAREMLHRIAHRQGLGNVLAEGVMRAAQQIGGEILQMAVYLKKGHAPKSHDVRAQWASALDQATSNIGTYETGTLQLRDRFSPEVIAEAVAREKGSHIFIDSLVMCQFPTLTKSSTNIDHLVEMLNATTGWSITPEEAKTAGVRIVNLLRAFNIRQGIGPDVEALSPRYSSAPTDGPHQGKSVAPYWEQMLTIYYKEMGWDRETGKPLPDTLRKLGLENLVADLWA